MPAQINILHITAHVGGGVGRVLLNYVSRTKNNPIFFHTIACLDYANENALRIAERHGLRLHERMASKKQELLTMLAMADIVLVHWWNHPLLYDLLVREEIPPCRTIFWSHISGFHPPYVFSEKALTYPDLFVFTTPVSYESQEVKNLSGQQKKTLRTIWSTSGIDHVRSVTARKHHGFNVGYIGTVDYCKMHPDFLALCSQVRIPELKFIVCGGPRERELEQEAEKLGIGKKINFTGLINDITEYLPVFDAFGYPLASYHYGTCDQVLAESMAAGIVPVVLANQMERFMVKDGVTGIVAKDTAEYVRALEGLFHNQEMRQTMASNAKKYALQTFSIDTMNDAWENVFNELLPMPKTSKKWSIDKNRSEITGKDVFLESLGSYGGDFIAFCNAVTADKKTESLQQIKKLAESPIWQAQTRGTVHHYHTFFPRDSYLSVWAKAMNE